MMKRVTLPVRLLAGPLLVIGVTVLVSACGAAGGTAALSSPPATPTLAQKYPAMKTAAMAAASVQVAGHIVQNGQAVDLDVILTRSGAASGWVALGGKRFTILVTKGKSYVQVSKLFLRTAHLPVSDCATVCGKYVQVPGSTSLAAGLSMTQLVDQIFSTKPTPSEGKLKLQATQYHGQPAWSAHEGQYAVYIARTGKPYPLAFTGNGFSVTLTGWNTASVPGPPHGSQLVTASQL